MRTILTWICGVVCIGIVTTLILIRIWPESDSDLQGSSTPQRAQKVATIIVEPDLYSEEVISTGTLRAFESIDIQVEVSGKLTHIGFTEGSLITKDTVLLQVDDAELQAELRRTQRRRDLAALREQRLAPLVAGGGISGSQYDEAASELAIFEAEIELIREQLARRTVRAPFDGVVGLRFVSEGAYVTPSTQIATFQYIDKMKLDFSLPERFSAEVVPGQKVQFSVVGREDLFDAVIFAVEPQIDEATRSLLVRAEVDNYSAGLRPGAFARVSWFAGRDEPAIFVPAVAVVADQDSDTVFVVTDGKVERRVVESGERSADRIRILKGLSAGEEVVTAGVQQVRPGMTVTTPAP